MAMSIRMRIFSIRDYFFMRQEVDLKARYLFFLRLESVF
jgi:hypothetical protein